MEKARNDPSVAVGESQKQQGGYRRGTKKQNKVHLASLMDIELEPQFLKSKGRVGPRGVTEQGSPAAKAAVDEEWEKLENIPAWDLTKVRSKSEVVDEARTKGAKVHFASLMDICHVKNVELETKHQKL